MAQSSGSNNGDPVEATPWSQVEAGEVVFLLDVRDGFEAELIRRWIDDTRPDDDSAPGHSIVTLDGSRELAAALGSLLLLLILALYWLYDRFVGAGNIKLG